MIKCETCKNKTDMSEGELYCTEECYGLGRIFDWCGIYDSALEYMEHLGHNFDKCEEYESNKV